MSYDQMSTPDYWTAGPQADLPVVPAWARMVDGVRPSLDRARVDRLVAIGAQAVDIDDIRFGHVESGAPLTVAHKGQILRFVLDTVCAATLTPQIAKVSMQRDVPPFDGRSDALLRASTAVDLATPGDVRACFISKIWSGRLSRRLVYAVPTRSGQQLRGASGPCHVEHAGGRGRSVGKDVPLGEDVVLPEGLIVGTTYRTTTEGQAGFVRVQSAQTLTVANRRGARPDDNDHHDGFMELIKDLLPPRHNLSFSH